MKFEDNQEVLSHSVWETSVEQPDVGEAESVARLTKVSDKSLEERGTVVTSFVPTQIEADASTQEERQHRIKDSENVEHPSASFKMFHPAKPSPSFLELPFTQRRLSRGHRCIQTVRLGHKQFSPDHQPQECVGLLECMHNHLQIQTKMVQAQFRLLEELQKSLSLLQASSEHRGGQQDNLETGLQGLTSSSK